MLTLVRGQFPRRELSGDAKPAAPRPKVARCDREMGVTTLSKLAPRFAPLAGLAVELQLGARLGNPLRALRRRLRPATIFRWQFKCPEFSGYRKSLVLPRYRLS